MPHRLDLWIMCDMTKHVFFAKYVADCMIPRPRLVYDSRGKCNVQTLISMGEADSVRGWWLILEKLGGLQSELSSCDRLSILKELGNDAIGVTKLSKKLGLTTQETSRQVFRLKEAGLLRKDNRGLYRLTSYAELVLKQLEGLDFVSRHKEYFKSHSRAWLHAQATMERDTLVSTWTSPFLPSETSCARIPLLCKRIDAYHEGVVA
jgi:DNA-binding transcriptional ArsR family regulator